MKKKLLTLVLVFAAMATFQMKAGSNVSCYTPYYATGSNLILDPGFDSTTTAKGGYGGWGVTGTPGFVTNSSAYCGKSLFIRGTCYPNGGSLDRALGTLKALTKYRLRAMVNSKATTGKAFQFQVEGVNGSASIYFNLPNTNGWKQIDTTFTTGATLGGTKGLYFNSCGSNSPLITDSCFLDNYELFTVPKIYTSPASLTFLGVGSKKVAVRAETLTQGITITASTGFTVSPTTMLATVSGGTTDSLTVTFNSATSKSGYVYFTSGTVKDSMQVTGTLAPALMTSVSYLSMDELNASGSFTVTGGNLTAGITMTAPAGITLNPSSLPSTASGTTVTATYNGAANSTGYITLTSTTATTRVRVRATRNADTFTQLYPSATNIVTDPYLNDLANFGGWGGGKSINTDTLYVYGGAKSGMLSGGQCSASIDRPLTGIMKTNTKYRTKAMVYAKAGSFQIGIYGWSGSKADTTTLISTTGSWQTVDFQFTSGPTLASGGQGMFFNSCWTGGTIGYIDNWELYEVPSATTGLAAAGLVNQNVYVQNQQVVADFNLASASKVEFAVYNTQGMLLSKQAGFYNEGNNRVVLNSNLTTGLYIVKTSIGGRFMINKIIF
jgi:hypothetical protein